MKLIKNLLIILACFFHISLMSMWQGPWKLYEVTPGAVESPATFWLNIASWRGDVDKVKQYLIEGGDPNAFIQNFRAGPDSNAFWIAVANGHTDVVRLLLANGANPNRQNRYRIDPATEFMIKDSMWGGPFPAQNLRDKGLTALMTAALAGFKPIVELLLDSGANPSKVIDGKTALDYAATPEIANLIHQYSTGAKKPTNTLKGKAITIPPSSISGEPERGEYVTRPEDIKFWYAAYYGDIGHLKKYLKSAKNINEKVYWSVVAKPALIMAIENKHSEAVRILLEHGADPNAPGSEGNPPLMFAAYSHAPIEIFQWLLDSGANPNTQSAGGTQLLWIVRDDVLNLLVKYINGVLQPTYSLRTQPQPQIISLEELSNQLLNLKNQLKNLHAKLLRR